MLLLLGSYTRSDLYHVLKNKVDCEAQKKDILSTGLSFSFRRCFPVVVVVVVSFNPDVSPIK